MSGSVHVTNGGSRGMMSNARLELPYPRVPWPSFGMKLLGGESNVTFVKRCKLVYPFNVFGEHGR